MILQIFLNALLSPSLYRKVRLFLGEDFTQMEGAEQNQIDTLTLNFADVPSLMFNVYAQVQFGYQDTIHIASLAVSIAQVAQQIYIVRYERLSALLMDDFTRSFPNTDNLK